MAQQATGNTWLDALGMGLGAYVDSQRDTSMVNSPEYNSGGGRAGQSQYSLDSLMQNPTVLIGGAVVLVLLLVLVLKK
jgi:hypothetical protein